MFERRGNRVAGAGRFHRVRPALALGAVLSMAALVPPAGAQTFSTIDEGLNVGRFVLHPSIAVEYTRDNNVLYGSTELPGDNLVDSTVWVIKPRILVDLPLGEDRIRWIYAPVYRNYATDRFDQADNLSHFFDLEGTFRVGPILGIRIADHLVRGTVELREVDRGGETVFGLAPFTTHSPEMEIALDLGARSGISLLPSYTSVDFDKREQATFFGYQKKSLEVRYNHRISPAATMYAFYSSEQTDQDREVNFFGEIALRSRSMGVGLRRSLNQAVVSLLTAGYKTIEFEGGRGHDFSGPVMEAGATWQVSDGTSVSLSAYRQAYQSFFVNNNYYVGHEARLGMTQQLGRNVYWQIGARLQGNVYADEVDISVKPGPCTGLDPDTDCDGLIDALESYEPSIGVRRRDRFFSGEVGAGYRFLRTLRAFIGYTFEGRRSNIEQRILGDLVDPFDYRVNRVFLRIEAGWL